MKTFDYSYDDIVANLKNVGIKTGDKIFIHSNLGFFGTLKDTNDPIEICTLFKKAIFEVIGKEGTLIVPTFSYSFTKNEIFDQNFTPSVCGIFSEFIRKDLESIRTPDPNFSIASIGPNTEFFTKNLSNHSFDENSFWQKFLRKNGKICNFNFDSGSTFIHYVEKLLNVVYRFDKGFNGTSITNGKNEDKIFYHFVYDLEKSTDIPDFTKFDKRAKELGLTKIKNLGKGQVLSISTRDTLELIQNEIIKNPSFLIKGSND